jgi:hypothetical protein
MPARPSGAIADPPVQTDDDEAEDLPDEPVNVPSVAAATMPEDTSDDSDRSKVHDSKAKGFVPRPMTMREMCHDCAISDQRSLLEAARKRKEALKKDPDNDPYEKEKDARVAFCPSPDHTAFPAEGYIYCIADDEELERIRIRNDSDTESEKTHQSTWRHEDGTFQRYVYPLNLPIPANMYCGGRMSGEPPNPYHVYATQRARRQSRAYRLANGLTSDESSDDSSDSSSTDSVSEPPPMIPPSQLRSVLTESDSGSEYAASHATSLNDDITSDGADSDSSSDQPDPACPSAE